MAIGNLARSGRGTASGIGRRRLFGAAAAVVLGAGVGILSGCGSSDSDSKDKATPDTDKSSAESDELLEEVTITNAATQVAASGAVFVTGTIVNTTKEEVTVVSATSPLSDKVELGSGGKDDFKAKADGFVVPAQGKLELKEGDDQIRLSEIKKPVVADDHVVVVLAFADKSTLQFTAVAK